MVNKKTAKHKDNILSLLRQRIHQRDTRATDIAQQEQITDGELAVLLGELEIFQLELEMQNEELAESARQLEAERSKFAGLFDLAPVGYVILDHIGVIEQANQTAADLLSIETENMSANRFQSFIDPGHLELFYAFLHRLQHSNKKESCELSLYTPILATNYTRLEGIKIQHPTAPKPQYYIAVIDITASRNAQQKLMDTSQRLEMTLSASNTGTWTMDMSDQKVFIDDHSCVLLGINSWNFDGTAAGFISLVHPDDQCHMRQQWLSAIHNLKEIDFQFRIISKDTTVKTLAIKGREVEDPERKGFYVGILMDVTERERLVEESRRLRNEKQRIILSSAFEAQEKERYRISNALHDSVCQLLYGIRLNLQNIGLKMNLDEPFKKVNRLLDDALKETRELSYELTPSILRDFGFSAGILEMARRLSTSEFVIKTSITPGVDELPQEIQLYLFRIIQELISNCIKHSGANLAKIIVQIERDTFRATVSDNGHGFRTGEEDALLQGSGLRSIRNRIFLLNGNMELSTSEKGSSIRISFSHPATFQGSI